VVEQAGPEEEAGPRRELPTLQLILRSLCTGGTAGGLLVLCAALFGAHLRNADERMGMVAAFGLTFLAAHASIEMIHSQLRGQPFRPALRRVCVGVAPVT